MKPLFNQAIILPFFLPFAAAVVPCFCHHLPEGGGKCPEDKTVLNPSNLFWFASAKKGTCAPVSVVCVGGNLPEMENALPLEDKM